MPVKRYRLIRIRQGYESGWTIGKTYKTDKNDHLTDDFGYPRLRVTTYNNAGDLFVEISFTKYYHQLCTK